MSPQRWHDSAVIYQIYPLSFRDHNGDGIGDLEGIIDKIDYLAGTLGIDAIWLSPIYPSPLADNGYDVADYTDVDPRFGDLATFDRLVASAHDRGVRVLVDWVPNHTSDRHPWFRASRSSRTDPKRDFYYWRDPKPDGSPPNNWVSVVSGPAWELDEGTGQYYLHTYLPEQPDLNWRTPAVREAMFATLRFWLDRGVDGFRIDVAHRLMKDPLLRDNPPNPEGINDYHKAVTEEYLAQLHVHDRAHPDVHELYRELRRLLDTYDGDRVALAEIHLADPAQWAAFYGDGDELHLPMSFALMNAAWEAPALRDAVERVEALLPPGAVPTLVLGNHDDHRLATRVGAAQSRVAAVLLLTLRGTTLLYQGDEIGMENVDVPPDRRRDGFGKAGGVWSRDGVRTPMQWSAAPRAGFSTAEDADLWLPVGPDHDTVNVECQLDDPGSLLNLYRRLLAYRRQTPALREGVYRSLEATPGGCLVFERQAGDQRVLVALNLTDATSEVALPGPGVVAVSTRPERSGPVEGTLALAAHEGVCIELTAA